MRVRSIPPITSTGSNRKKSSSRLEGLAHMSIGRYMAIKRTSEEENDSWDIGKYSKSDFNNRTKQRVVTPDIYETEQITCVTDIIYNYNEDGDLAIIIEFNGFEFVGTAFDRTTGSPEPPGYFIPVNYKKKRSSLYLTSTGGIFEYKVCVTIDDCLFGNTINIPELMHEYNSSTMVPTLKNNWVIVTYKKRSERS